MSVIFALLTLGLAVNQVATGLALDHSGRRRVGSDRRRFRRRTHHAGAGPLTCPVLTSICRSSAASCSARDAFVYVSLALIIAHVVVPVPHPRRAGAARGRRQSRLRPCARLSGADASASFAVMFGGACAGLGGAYLPLAYTPFFVSGMTAGRGWIALALVVFASWLPGRLVIGAYLFGAVTILQLHAQGAGFGMPSQLMTALPYLATIVVLVAASRGRAAPSGPPAPASLGTVFVPDR